MKTSVCASALALSIFAGAASAQVNGSYKPAYGAPLVVQQDPTGFGDAGGGNIQTANGSELDAAFFNSSGGVVNLLFTGNLESNFNKFVIFIDNGNPLGQNQITGAAGLPGQYTGMRFDAGFRATQWLSITCGGGTFGMFVDGSDLLANVGGYQGGNDGQSGGVLSGGTNQFGALVALNNSNSAGVTGSSAAGALSATTGIEVQLPLAALGLATPNFKVCAFINGQNHDYASNQFLGSLPAGQGNLGGDGFGTFNGGVGGLDLAGGSYAGGNQYFVVPAPGVLNLLGLGGLIAARRRRA